MRKSCLLLIVAALVLPSTLQAATYDIDRAHSSVGFSIRHLVSRVVGRFADFQGVIEYDEGKPEASSVNVTIQSASITTDIERRDNHLKSADFFDVEKFPTITFTSTAVQKTSGGLEVEGNLTMHGVTKTLKFPVEVLGTMTDPQGKSRAGFSGELTLDRKDFGILWNHTLDQGGTILGDDVKITLFVEAVRR